MAEKCPSIVMSTAALSGQVNQIARVIRVMRLDVALAHKLAAWNERRLVRDLYDIYSLYTVLGEKPDRHTLINRLSHFNSRLPALRSIKQMSIEDFSSQLLQEANSLTAERLQPLHALLEETACIGLEHKIRISLYDIVVFLQQW